MVLNQEYEKYLKQKALFEKEHEVKKKKLVKVYRQFGTQMIYTHIQRMLAILNRFALYKFPESPEEVQNDIVG